MQNSSIPYCECLKKNTFCEQKASSNGVYESKVFIVCRPSRPRRRQSLPTPPGITRVRCQATNRVWGKKGNVTLLCTPWCVSNRKKRTQAHGRSNNTNSKFNVSMYKSKTRSIGKYTDT